MNSRGLLAPALLALLLAAMASAGCDQAPHEEESAKAPAAPAMVWRMASAYALDGSLLGTGATRVVNGLTAASDGRFKIEVTGPGAENFPSNLFEAVSARQMDAALSDAGAWSNTVPASAFFSAVPFGPDAPELLAWLYEGGGLELWRDIFEPRNLYPLPCGLLPPEASGWFHQPVEKPSQFKGMRIRSVGLGGLALQRLGASVHQLAKGDIFTALERGVLDGTFFSFPVEDSSQKFFQIAKHYYFPGWQHGVSLLQLVVNLHSWRDLTLPDQALVRMTCESAMVRGFARAESVQGAALDNLKRQGVRIHYWSADMLSAFKKAYEEVVSEMTAKDPDFARVHASFTAFREGYREWAGLSRLPAGFQQP